MSLTNTQEEHGNEQIWRDWNTGTPPRNDLMSMFVNMMLPIQNDQESRSADKWFILLHHNIQESPLILHGITSRNVEGGVEEFDVELTWFRCFTHQSGDKLLRLLPDYPADRINHEIQDVLDEFRKGIDGEDQPLKNVVEMATKICQTAIKVTDHPDIIVDDDGALSFDFRLKSGYLIMAEIEIDGLIAANLYDEHDELLEEMTRATEKDFIRILQS